MVMQNKWKRIYSGEVTTIKELSKLKEKHDAAREKVNEYEEKALDIMEELEKMGNYLYKKR